MTKSSPFSHIGYFYLFDWLKILVWYIICQVKPTCKVSDSNSISKLIFTLHVPSKHSVSTPLWRNGVQFCTSYTCICSIDLKFQYDTLFAKLNRHAKFQTVTRSRSRSLHCMHRLNTVFLHPYYEMVSSFAHRILVFVRLTWNFSTIHYLPS